MREALAYGNELNLAGRDLGSDLVTLISVLFQERLDVNPPKPHHPTDVMGSNLAPLDQTIDGHLGDTEKLSELFDGVKLLGQLGHGFTR